MGNKHKPKAGTIINQQQRGQIKKLEDALFSEKWHRDNDHNKWIEGITILAHNLIDDLNKACREEQKINPLLMRLEIQETDKWGRTSKKLILPMKAQKYSATTLYIVCQKSGFGKLHEYIRTHSKECGGLIEWMFNIENIHDQCRTMPKI